VELAETSDIVHHANERTLCLIDELGRGTATHDGYAIAAATLRHLSRRCVGNECPLVIFSTHYHALAMDFDRGMSSRVLDVQLGYMDFTLSQTEGSSILNVTFLFKLVQGVCSRSYGIEVALQAGIAMPIVEMAQQKSRELSAFTVQQQALQIVKEFVCLAKEEHPSVHALTSLKLRCDALALGERGEGVI
jgi:DNA mismatch repair protein MSH6